MKSLAVIFMLLCLVIPQVALAQTKDLNDCSQSAAIDLADLVQEAFDAYKAVLDASDKDDLVSAYLQLAAVEVGIYEDIGTYEPCQQEVVGHLLYAMAISKNASILTIFAEERANPSEYYDLANTFSATALDEIKAASAITTEWVNLLLEDQ